MSSQSPRESIELASWQTTPLRPRSAFPEDQMSHQQEAPVNNRVKSTLWTSETSSKQASSAHDLLLPRPPPLRRRFWERIGKSGVFLLITGPIFLFGCLSVLLFLWVGADRAANDKDPGIIWQTIIFSTWITRTITISAAVMRAVITTQAALVTSMVAALLLESASTELHQLPFMSLARAIRMSPIHLVKPQLFEGNLFPKAAYMIIILLLSVLVVASQLISTILFSDFAVVLTAKPINSTNLHLSQGVPVKGLRSEVDVRPESIFYWSSPNAFWRFAEYHEGAAVQDVSDKIMYTDTGVTLRASLPWANLSSRLNLKQYKGSAHVWDARVLCISPILNNVTFEFLHDLDSIEGINQTDGQRIKIPHYMPFVDAADPSPTTISPLPTLTLHDVTTLIKSYPTPTAIYGNISYNNEYAVLNSSSRGSKPFSFNCSLPFLDGAVICGIDGMSAVTLESSLRGGQSFVQPGVYLVLKLNLTEFQPLDNASELVIGENQTTKGWSLFRHGPWAMALDQSNHQMFSASACFNNADPFNFNVTISGTAIRSEPTIGWLRHPEDVGLLSGAPDTSEVRRQLGVTLDHMTKEIRGILDLDPIQARPDSVHENDAAGISNADYYSDRTLALPHIVNGTTTIRRADQIYLLHDAHRILFLDILNSTNNPAYAIQAFLTTFYQMEYFESSYKWSYGFPASYVFCEEVSIPVNKLGFIIVAGIVALHTIIVGTTVTLFLSRTRTTQLGNAWQSVAQVVSDRTIEVLWKVDSMTDKEVKETLSNSAGYLNIQSTGVIRRRQNGRNEFGSKGFE